MQFRVGWAWEVWHELGRRTLGISSSGVVLVEALKNRRGVFRHSGVSIGCAHARGLIWDSRLCSLGSNGLGKFERELGRRTLGIVSSGDVYFVEALKTIGIFFFMQERRLVVRMRTGLFETVGCAV